MTPAFIPVGTKATVKAVLPETMAELGAQSLLANAYHLYLQPGPDIVDEERREAYAQRAQRFKEVNRIQREMMSAARHAVLAARSEPGSDPEVVDRVLRHLDVRSLR